MPQTGAEHIRWCFDDLYSSEQDPQLQQDIQNILTQAEAFAATYRGQLASRLGEALQALCALEQQEHKVYAYLMLRAQVETENESLKKVLSAAQEQLALAHGAHLTFWEHEIAHLPEEAYQTLLQADTTVAKHQPYLEDIRRNARYLLAENVEEALAKRSPFGPAEWEDFMDEQEATLTFTFEGKQFKMEEILDMMGREPNGDRRAAAMACFNAGLKTQKMDKAMARAWNVVMGAQALEDAERGFESPMHARNLDNKVDAATVQALHDAVEQVATPLAVRYYRLKAKWLGQETLRWSDRNAPLPITDTSTIPWKNGFAAVKDAFGSFSPTLRGLVEQIEANGWIDAPVYAGKRGGAFCAGMALPGENGEAQPRAYVMLNHMGTLRDFVTLAHELGHAVHDMLAIPAQNSLMWSPPMAYAETASIFAEMVTFNHLLGQCPDDQAKLALYMDKASDFINTVVRQISFSCYEQATHAQRRHGKLTTDDFSALWLESTERFYGKEGEVFTYANMDIMWCYVHHFLSPFYVYAYAFGELFTQSLYAVKDRFGEDFEPMYLDLLRAGNTKDAVALMQPFGLDPTDPAFWTRGIEASLGVWLTEAEKLSEKLNYQAQ